MIEMNLPNKLTIIRVLLILPFVVLMLKEMNFWALAIFVIASLTDLADGKIARKYNLVTNFGKFMDPLADKLLVCSAMILLIQLGRIPAWVVVVIISREFIISGFRLIAADNRVVIAASYWGKWKTVFQMFMVCLMIANISALQLVTNIVMWIALALTVISLADYLVKNWSVMGATPEGKEVALVQTLKEKNLTIAFAESCTGGLLSGRVVNVAGASDVYKAGFVTYANEAKVQFAGVKEETLESFGAVSEQTAREMAVGTCAATGADVSCAVTGIAGPDGGTEEKPVGLVYIACSVKGEVTVEEHHFTGKRQEVREASVKAALDLLERSI